MSAAATWGGLARWWLADTGRFQASGLLVPAAAAALVAWSPLAASAIAVTGGLAVWLWRDRAALALLLVVLMCNVKVNYYTGFVTLFPEYPVLLVGGLVVAMRAMEGRWRIREPGLAVLFLWWIIAGAVSGTHALELTRVASKGILLALAAAIFFAVLEGLDNRRSLSRALRWLELSAVVVGLYAVAQIAGGALGIDTSLGFLEAYSNPEFHLGVGVPIIYQLTKIFRANAFFNDPNILGGYLAAVMSVVLALRLHHSARARHRVRARLELALLLLLGIALLLTVSRSGFLAFAAGAACVLWFMPGILRRARFWVASAVLSGLMIAGSALSGINPIVLFTRLGQSFDRGDGSNRVHFEAAEFAIELVRRFPLTGGGLRNFGYHYAAEVNAFYPNMMAHNAWLDFFAETGLFGGLAFTALTAAILWRPLRALRDRGLGTRDPELQAWLVGLLAALVALNVANLFYDYYLRTFVWVFSGMAVAASSLAAGCPLKSPASRERRG